MGTLREAALLARELRCEGWREPAVLMVDESGKIRDGSRASEELFGYSLRDLLLLHVSALLPQLSGIELLQNGAVNPELAGLCQRGHVFWAENRYGDVFPSELGVILEPAGARMLRLLVLRTENGNELGDARPVLPIGLRVEEDYPLGVCCA